MLQPWAECSLRLRSPCLILEVHHLLAGPIRGPGNIAHHYIAFRCLLFKCLKISVMLKNS